MKNAIIIFAALIVLSPSVHSAIVIQDAHNKTHFLNKFEQTFKLEEVKHPTKNHKKQFDDFFKKVIKK